MRQSTMPVGGVRLSTIGSNKGCLFVLAPEIHTSYTNCTSGGHEPSVKKS